MQEKNKKKKTNLVKDGERKRRGRLGRKEKIEKHNTLYGTRKKRARQQLNDKNLPNEWKK